MSAPQTKDTPNWTARLELEFQQRKERTVLARNKHQGPLLVQHPLYPEGNICHTYILHPPGGVVGGDLLEIDVVAQPGAAALITTPGATKFYRSQGKKASQRQHITVQENASLEWFPQDTIFFPGAMAKINTRIDLASNAHFIGWEINCLGLPVNKELFLSGRLQTQLALYRENKPIFLDTLRIEQEKDLNRRAGLRGFPVTATFLATGSHSAMLAEIRGLQQTEPNSLFGATLMDDLLVARVLGYSTFAVQALFAQIWAIIRPLILNQPACPPRIWAT